MADEAPDSVTDSSRDLLRALSTAFRILRAERNQAAALLESFEHAARGFSAGEALLLQVVSTQPPKPQLEKMYHLGKLTPRQIQQCVSLESIPGSGVSPSLIREAIETGQPKIVADSRDLDQRAHNTVSLAAAPHSVIVSVVTDPWVRRSLAVLYFQRIITNRGGYTADHLQILEAYTTALSQAVGLFLSNEREVEEFKRARPRAGSASIPQIIGDSPETTRLRIRLKDVFIPATCKPKPNPILITGPTGVGKGAYAEYVHYFSPIRHKGPYVYQNCSLITGNLAEAALFGSAKGAYTGSVGPTQGRFREANGGILFLDEIGIIPDDGQKMLLHVLDSSKIRPIGSQIEYDVDVQVILATNANLREEVAKGRFREDLYHRIKALTIAIPPLADRIGDIGPLLIHFFKQEEQVQEKRTRGLGALALQALCNYHWPGNVRELKSVVTALVTEATDGQLLDQPLLRQVCPEVFENTKYKDLPQMPNGTFEQERERWERAFILNAFKLHDWSVSETAKTLGFSRTTFYRYMKQYGILRPDGPQEPETIEPLATEPSDES